MIKGFASLLLLFTLSFQLKAQSSIVQFEDETLPIAPMRYDEAVEIPKNNFSSVDGKDKWERFENGELDAKAFIELQEEYNAMVSQKPNLKRKIASQRKKNLAKENRVNSGNLLKKKKSVKSDEKKERKPSNQKLPPKKIKKN